MVHLKKYSKWPIVVLLTLISFELTLRAVKSFYSKNEEIRVFQKNNTEKFKVVVLGESTSVGHAVKKADTWFSLLKDKYPNIEWINLAQIGTTSHWQFKKFKEYIEKNGTPNTVITMLGVNDINRYELWQEYKGERKSHPLLLISFFRKIYAGILSVGQKNSIFYKSPWSLTEKERLLHGHVIEPKVKKKKFTKIFSEVENKILKNKKYDLLQFEKDFFKVERTEELVALYKVLTATKESAVEQSFLRYEVSKELLLKRQQIYPLYAEDFFQQAEWHNEQNDCLELLKILNRKKITISTVAMSRFKSCAPLERQVELETEFRKIGISFEEFKNLGLTEEIYRRLISLAKGNDFCLISLGYPRDLKQTVPSFIDEFSMNNHIYYVDQSNLFEEEIQKGGNESVFVDMFGGNFGHMNEKGHRLFAKNAADRLEKMPKKCFNPSL